jgi:hypothetical protein
MWQHIKMCRQVEYSEVKGESNPTHESMSAGFTFLLQVKTNLVVLIGQLPMLAHEIMVHVPMLIIHALQKC